MAFTAPIFRWRPHPGHGIEVGRQSPPVVKAAIEINPYDPARRGAAVEDSNDDFGGFG